MNLKCSSLRTLKSHIKYFKNGDRCNVRVNRSRIGSHQCAVDGHHHLWPWTTLNCPGSRSSKLQIKYFKNGDRYDDAVSRSRIGNRTWVIDWLHDLWPWITLNCPRSKSQDFLVKYLEYEDRYNVGLKGGQIANHQWAFDWHYKVWPWMTLNCAGLDSGAGNSMHLANTRSIECISCYNIYLTRKLGNCEALQLEASRSGGRPRTPASGKILISKNCPCFCLNVCKISTV